MSIEIYATTIIYIYMALFLLFILTGVVYIWNRIRKKTFRFWWGIIPCSILYSISAMFSTFAAFIAYDDPADPNYARYKDWELHNFILHDIKTLIIWLFIGSLLYLIFGRKSTKRSIKTGCAIFLIFLIVLSGITVFLSITPSL